MSGSAVRAGLAFVEVALRSKVKEGVRQIQAQLSAVSSSFKTFGTGLAAAGGTALAAFGAVGSSLVAAATGFGKAGAALDDMSQRTGIAGSTLSALSYVAGQSGTDIAVLEGGLRKMQKSLVDAGSEAKGPSDALARLGLSADRLLKLTPDQQFASISAAIAKIEDPTRRAAAAMEIFGKSGTQLLPMMQSDVRGLITEAKSLGLVLSNSDIDAAAKLDDSFDRAFASIRGLFNTIGAAIAEPLTIAVNAFAGLIGQVSRFISENRTLVTTLGAIAAAGTVLGGILLSVGGAIVGIGATLGSLPALIPMVTAGFAALSGAVSAVVAAVAPFAGTIAIIAGVGTAITYAASRTSLLSTAINGVASVFGSLGSTAFQTFGGIASALGNGEITKAAKVLWVGVKLAFFTGAKAAYDAFTWLFNNAWSIIKSIGAAIVETIGSIFSQIPRIIKAAITGGESIAAIIAATLEGKLGPLLKDQVDKAQAELDALTGKSAKPHQASGSVGGQPNSNSTTGHDAVQMSGGLQPGQTVQLAAQPQVNTHVTHSTSAQQQTTNISHAPINHVTHNHSALPSVPAGMQSENNQPVSSDDSRKAFEERVKSLRDEITEMRLGANAADLLRLRQQGLSDEQIKAVWQLQQQRDAVAKQRKAQEDAVKARDDATRAAEDEVKQSVERGKQLAEEVRTPFQVMQDKLSEINRLRAGGFIDDNTAYQQRQKATDEFRQPMRDAVKSGRNSVAEVNTQAAMDIIIRNQRTFSFGTNNTNKKNPLEDYAREQRDYLRIIADQAGKGSGSITVKTRRI